MSGSGESSTGDPISPRAVALGAPRARWWLASAVVFVSFALASAQVWEPAHDEGVTWTQTFGALDLSSCPATASRAAAVAYPAIDGRSHRSLGEVVTALVSDGVHPPAYYLLVNLWASWVGTGRVALSVPAIALGVFSLLAMGWLARALSPGRTSELWAMLLLACSPWFVGYSVFARPYGLVLFASLWSTVALLEMQAARGTSGTKRLRWRVIFVAVTCLGLYSLYHYIFVLLWQGAALALLAWQSGESRRNEFAALFGMAAAVACGFAPWLSSLAVHLSVASASPYYFAGWVPLGDWPQKWAHLLLVFGLGEGIYSSYAAELRVAAAALALCTLPLALRSLSPASLRTLAPAARVLWTAAPLLPLSILASDWLRQTHTLFISKTTFALLPLLILLALRSWQEMPRRWLATVGLSLWVLLCASATLAAIQTSRRALTSFEVVAEYLRRTDVESHHVVLSSARRGYVIPFLLTLRKAEVRRVQISLAPPRQLAACLDFRLSDPGSERLTLVDFAVPYELRSRWPSEELRRGAKTARSLGWHELGLAPADPEVGRRARHDRFWQRFVDLPGAPRVLVIASPTKAKYFSE